MLPLRLKWEKLIFWTGVITGCCIGALICYQAYTSITVSQYCLVLEDNFTSINKSTWNYEIQRGGFGTGSFEWTTDDPRNAYIDAQGLHLVPTLTTKTTQITPAEIYNQYTLNLTKCHSEDISDCFVRSSSAVGSIVNPVRSARLNTRGHYSIQYGRVEVIAKMPKGDWLWPAIWMMPENSTYGGWPASGEIDIVESRGNRIGDHLEARDTISSTLHWGPVSAADAFWRTSGKHTMQRSDYTEAFHTFGLEWNAKYLFTYVDTRLRVGPLCLYSFGLCHRLLCKRHN